MRPAWFEGKGLTPVAPWHSRQSARPSRVWGIAGIPPVDVAVGAGVVGAGVVSAGVVGEGVGAPPPPQAASRGSVTNNIMASNHTYFFIIPCPHSLICNLYNVSKHDQQKGRLGIFWPPLLEYNVFSACYWP